MMSGKSRNGTPQDAATAGLTFEKALANLEEIVRRLEGGDLSLDSSIQQFQEGMALARFCSGKLDEAERRIDQLLGEAAGEVVAEPFPLELDDVEEVG